MIENNVEEQVPPLKPSWDETYINMCHEIARRSHDPRTKIGSVVIAKDMSIRSVGYNGLPRGISPREEILISPEKYNWMSHAEENAIANAARTGVSLIDATIYVNLMPCSGCARTIIQNGISEVVIHRNSQDIYEKTSGRSGSYWDESFKCTKLMFAEAGVKMRFVDYSPNKIVGFFNGQEFTV